MNKNFIVSILCIGLCIVPFVCNASGGFTYSEASSKAVNGRDESHGNGSSNGQNG